MRLVNKPLWPQPPVPWWIRVGAVALWCGVAAWAVYGLALALPSPWSEVGWLSLPPAGLAPLLGLYALAAAPPLQKGLGLVAVAFGVLFFVMLRLS